MGSKIRFLTLNKQIGTTIFNFARSNQATPKTCYISSKSNQKQSPNAAVKTTQTCVSLHISANLQCLLKILSSQCQVKMSNLELSLKKLRASLLKLSRKFQLQMIKAHLLLSWKKETQNILKINYYSWIVIALFSSL